MNWQVVETEWGDRHVMPINDLRPHLSVKCCWCMPRPDPDDGHVIVHDAMDLRQERERAEVQ